MVKSLQPVEQLSQVRAVQTWQRHRYLARAAASLLIAVASCVGLAIEHGYLPKPRSSIWTPVGDAVVSVLPNAGIALVGGSLLATVVCVYMAYAPWVTRRRLRRVGA